LTILRDNPLPVDAGEPQSDLAEASGANKHTNGSADTQEPAAEAPRLRFSQEYVELKRLVKQRGLMERQPLYYAFKMLLTISMLAACIVSILVVQSPWLQLLNAVLLAFTFTQLGFVGHDVGHHQTLRTNLPNTIVGFIFGNLLIGVSRGWWVDKHNQHHGHPNQIEMDPDIDFPFLAFSEEQLEGKQGLARLIAKNQAYWLMPLFCLTAISLRSNSIQFLVERKARYMAAETALLVAHFGWYFGLLFYALGFWPALLFALIHQAMFGLYMASVFAPNHKGMPVLNAGEQMDFMRQQILTARNVSPNPIVDFWYGGLNYQIEHHLFPNMPRNRLGEARLLVQDVCRRYGIEYYETGPIQSYKEIFQFMHDISAPLRAVESEAAAS
jgi:fatty acid desaturase